MKLFIDDAYSFPMRTCIKDQDDRQAIKYDYRATLTGTGDRSLPQLDLDLTVLRSEIPKLFLSYS